MAQFARTQPQGLARINRSNPLTRGIVDAWLPGVTSRGIVSGVDSSTIASGSVGATPSGVGFNVTATGRRYSTTILNGQPAAWLVVASRDNSGGQNVSLVRKDGTFTPVQEWDGQLRAVYFNGGGGFAGLTNYGPTSGFGGRINTFCGVTSSSEQVVFANGGPNIAAYAATTGGTNFNPFCIGASESGGEIATAWTTLLVVLWQGSSVPTSAQLRALSANPWQLFDSPSQTQFPQAAAATTGTGATATPAGVAASSAVGSAAAQGAANVSPAGVAAASAVGAPIASGASVINGAASPAGVSATASVGTATASGATVISASAAPAGISAASAVGSAAASGQGKASPAGVSASSAVGAATATGQAISYATPAGVSASAAVGTPSISAGARVYPLGVQATAYVGYAHGPINLAQYPQIFAESVMSAAPVYSIATIKGAAGDQATMSAGPLFSIAKMRADPINQIASFT